MFKLSTQKPINYTIKIGLLFIILHYIYNRILFLPLPDLIYNDSIGQVDLILIPLLLIIFMFIHFKISNKELKFMDYLKVGWFFSTLMFVYSVVFYDFNIGMAFPLSGNLDFDDLYYEAPYVIFLCLGILSSLLSVFFPKGTIKEKLGNLVKVVLFVIIIYKLIKPFIGGSDDDDDDNDDDAVGFDTDGDGKIDTTFVDTDGDGIAETIAQDTDGDGIIDTVSSDTDGDGLIDTVVADTDGDGLADTIIKDVDIDGDGQSDYRITKRKGKGLT
jgi:hypothetical protein|tara:strand:+ start:473 stop:1291 length:819 start_codon:yes stop_codon:yes gene_type:complete